MYKVASDGRQRVLSNGRLADWVTWDGKQSAEEQLANLQRVVSDLDAKIKQSGAPEEKKALGLRKLAAQNELCEFKKIAHLQRKQKQGIAQYFMDVAKEQLPPGQFKAIFAAADRMRLKDAEKLQKEAEGQA